MRTFTLDEAQWLLPVLQGLLKTAMDGKRTIESVETELTAVNHRIFLCGGMLPDITHLAQRRAARDKAALAAKDALAEIDAIGVQVKALDMGLLDFPCKVENDIVLLCWKAGETEITHWHGIEEGFRGRKPITEAIRRASNQKSH
jgi:hypothetical protein